MAPCENVVSYVSNKHAASTYRARVAGNNSPALVKGKTELLLKPIFRYLRTSTNLATSELYVRFSTNPAMYVTVYTETNHLLADELSLTNKPNNH
jgi:hypothetical protein